MAKIVLNEDVAPKGQKSFSLANANFDVPYETNDQAVLASARSHPWLRVEVEQVEGVEPQFVSRSVRPEDDALSGFNSIANDPKAVREALEAREDLKVVPLAVDAGLDQDKPKTVGKGDSKVAVTLAADETDSTAAPKGKAAAKDKEE